MKVKAFVSSTFLDLTYYRKITLETLLGLGIETAMMEYFPSSPVDPTEACLKEIKNSDLFIGIYAHRYGSIPEGESKSVIEIEFDHAEKLAKPIFCYFVDDEYPWAPKLIEDEPGRSKLNSFKERLKIKSKSLLIKSFKDPENLGRLLASSMGRWLQDKEYREKFSIVTATQSISLVAVFGKRLIDGTITKEGLSRIKRLINYLREAKDKNEDVIITFTGGRIDRYEISESETFLSTYYRYLYEQQPEFPHIISYPVRLDRQSTKTIENVQNVILMMKNEGTLEPGTRLLVKLCTSDYHLDRIMKIHELIPPQSILKIFETEALLEKTKTIVELAGDDQHLRAMEDLFDKNRMRLYIAIDKLTVFRVFMEWIVDKVKAKFTKISNQTMTKVSDYIKNCINDLDRLPELQKHNGHEEIFNETYFCFKEIDDLLSAKIITNLPLEMIGGVVKVLKETVQRCEKNYETLYYEYYLFDRLLTDINRIVDPDEKLNIDAPRLEKKFLKAEIQHEQTKDNLSSQ